MLTSPLTGHHQTETFPSATLILDSTEPSSSSQNQSDSPSIAFALESATEPHKRTYNRARWARFFDDVRNLYETYVQPNEPAEPLEAEQLENVVSP